jgi:RecJ-like exonuclease
MANKLQQWWINVQRSAETKTEYIKWCGEVMAISRNGRLSQSQKRSGFKHYIGILSEDAYQKNFKKIMKIVQRTKVQCEPYKNSEEQVGNILLWIPRFQDHRELVLQIVQERRKKYKLAV